MSHPDSDRAPLGRRLVAILHGAFLALLVAYALKGALKQAHLDEAGTFGWRVFTALMGDWLGPPRDSVRTTALLVSDAYFEGPFAQASPLDRGELAKIVGAIDASLDPAVKPVVMIDLDLSPLARPDEAARRAQDALDASLRALAKRATVVLLCPFARTQAVRTDQVAWSERLQNDTASLHDGRGGIHFALPELELRSGAYVTDYFPQSPSLGVRTGQLLARAGTDGAPPKLPLVSCAGKPWSPAAHEPRHKIPPGVFRSVVRYDMDSADKIGEAMAGTRPRLVVLGGSYAIPGDDFIAANNERMPGALLHAFIAASAGSGIDHPPGKLDVLVQLLGVALVLGVGEWFGHRIFHRMVPHPRTSHSGPPVSALELRAVRLMWSPHGGGPAFTRPAARFEVEAWMRWLVGMLGLAAVLALASVAFCGLSYLLILWFGAWFDPVIAAIAAWLKVLAHQSQALTGFLGSHGAANALYGKPPVGSNYVWRVAGIATRLAVLAYGFSILVLKLVSH